MQGILQYSIWIPITSVVISFFLLYKIVSLILKTDYFGYKRDYGWKIMKTAKYQKIKGVKIWNLILNYISQPDPVKWREAILKADDLMDDVLRDSGYKGYDLNELLTQVDSSKISNIDEIKRIRFELKELLKDEDVLLDREKVKEFLREYRQAFRQFGLLD